MRHLFPHSRTLLLALAPPHARKKNARKKKGGKGDIKSNNRAAPKVRAPTAETEAGGDGNQEVGVTMPKVKMELMARMLELRGRTIAIPGSYFEDGVVFKAEMTYYGKISNTSEAGTEDVFIASSGFAEDDVVFVQPTKMVGQPTAVGDLRVGKIKASEGNGQYTVEYGDNDMETAVHAGRILEASCNIVITHQKRSPLALQARAKARRTKHQQRPSLRAGVREEVTSRRCRSLRSMALVEVEQGLDALCKSYDPIEFRDRDNDFIKFVLTPRGMLMELDQPQEEKDVVKIRHQKKGRDANLWIDSKDAEEDFDIINVPALGGVELIRRIRAMACDAGVEFTSTA